MKHEEGHLKFFQRGFAKLISDLEALAGETGKEVETRIRKARQAIQDEHDDYDTKTGNGVNVGVVFP